MSAAYHDLLEQGWLELRRGSGLFVRAPQASANELDRLLTGLLQSARSSGYEPEEVLRRLEHMVHRRRYEEVVIVEPEPAMREILAAELTGHAGLRVEVVAPADLQGGTGTLVAALPTRAARVRRELPEGVLCVPLRIRSVGKSIEGETRPGRNVVISIVSRSREIRHWARAMLIAVGIDPEALCEVDATGQGWQERIDRSGLAVADVVVADELPANCPVRVFRIVADSSIEELKQLCGCDA